MWLKTQSESHVESHIKRFLRMNGFDRTAIIEIIVRTYLTKSTHKPNDGITDTYFAIYWPQPFFHADMFCLFDNGNLIAEKLRLSFTRYVYLCHASRWGIEQETVPFGNAIGDWKR